MAIIDGLPPGPRWPRAAQTAAWGLRPVELVRHCRERYGDLFTLRTLGLGDMVFVASPELIKEVFTGEEFRPERFLGEGAPPYTFIPFGGGARRCIGAAFAMMEMKVVLREALSRVELRPTDDPGEPPRTHNVMLVPKRGARVVIERVGG